MQVGAGIVGPARDLRGVFVGSLIPIAFVYALAHYLTYLLVRPSTRSRCCPTPTREGWDLIGTAGFEPKLDVLTPNQTWYTQVTVLVIGHVVAPRRGP